MRNIKDTMSGFFTNIAGSIDARKLVNSRIKDGVTIDNTSFSRIYVYDTNILGKPSYFDIKKYFDPYNKPYNLLETAPDIQKIKNDFGRILNFSGIGDPSIAVAWFNYINIISNDRNRNKYLKDYLNKYVGGNWKFVKENNAKITDGNIIESIFKNEDKKDIDGIVFSLLKK